MNDRKREKDRERGRRHNQKRGVQTERVPFYVKKKKKKKIGIVLGEIAAS